MNILLSILLSVVVSAQIDSASIAIGDQTALRLEASASAGEHVQMPILGDQLVNGIDIVERSAIDTITSDGKTTYQQKLTITSFTDSLFYVDPLPFLVNGDTVRSTGLTLNVIQPFELDSTEAITDIKPVMKPKIWWWGIFRWVLLGLAIVALGIGIFFLVKYLKGKQKPEEKIDPELLRPCNEVALEKLDQIKEQKLWQTGMHKQYFTELTDVVREYIGRRFDISSTEKTSDETLEAIRPVLTESDQKELYTRLEKMLRLADLVKFAKWNPTPDENETSLVSAYTFVRECGDIPAKPETEEAETKTSADDGIL